MFTSHCFSKSILFAMCLILISANAVSADSISEPFGELPGWRVQGDAEHAKREQALATSLEKTIGLFPGISRARVHLSLRDTRLLSRNPSAVSKAAIVIWRNTPVPQTLKLQIERLVIAAIPDLEKSQLEIQYFSDVSSASSSESTLSPDLRIVIISLLLLCTILAGGWIRMGMRRHARRG